jgi:hypothetical protein
LFNRKTVRRPRLLDNAALAATAERYRDYPVARLSYGTVRDYCDSFDHLRPLATANGDLKDQQRPWMLKALLSQVKAPRGRLLEIGAGEPLVADLMQRLGREVWIVDPYDGSGNGPREYELFSSTYPKLRFIRAQFTESLQVLEPRSFDCIYSISVLEHIPPASLERLIAAMRLFLKPNGVSMHAVDHVHRGNEADKHLESLRLMTKGLGLEQRELDQALAAMSDDTETYYLSAESHNRWRAGVPYDQFPMRICVSIQFCTEAASILDHGGADGL